jgi:hypothetical protein
MTPEEPAAPHTAPNHDYRRTLGDWFLEGVKALVPSAETRHALLARYARKGRSFSGLT